MRGQWVDVGARRLIDGTALDSRSQTRHPTCDCSLRPAGRFGLRRRRGRYDGRLPSPLQLDAAVAQALWAALFAVAAYLAIWSGLFIYHLLRYRSSRFRDHDWLARHDDSDPGGALFLELRRRSGGSLNPGVDLELCVKSHGNWEVVDNDEVVLMPDKVIRCRFDLNHEVFPGGFYDVRWFRADDRGKLVEITRERFQLRNHFIGPRTRVSRTNRKLAPKALPTSEDEIKPRRLAPEAVASGNEISPRRAVEAH
jgi:hypothetical protein